MIKNFCCCFSFKTGAFVMCFINSVAGVAFISVGIQKLVIHDSPHWTAFLILSVVLGIMCLFNAGLLLTALMKAKERYILLYITLEMVVVGVVSIFAGVYMFKNALCLLLFIVAMFMWYTLYAAYGLYEETASYNKTTCGAIEISYNNPQAYTNSLAINEEEVSVV